MKLNTLPADPGSLQPRKRKGRGMSSGHGKTSTRGHKGQKARSGGYHKVGFEGGQMPLQRRLPKRGFKNRFKKQFALINVGDLAKFDAGTTIGVEELQKGGLLPKSMVGRSGIKLLGNGEISVALTVNVDLASAAAISKVEKAGGSVQVATADKE
ncbi:MAG: 50S ribosomal protein L15 [Magnetococcales bacterium]|nr:50S ribosomal protein L15 [Magnetococcales bacterium]